MGAGNRFQSPLRARSRASLLRWCEVRPMAIHNKWNDCKRVLVLQGGGALGAYQGGVYEAIAHRGGKLDWVTGISIGAINAALIAGNPPQLRVERLRTFWELVSASCPHLGFRMRTDNGQCSTRPARQ